MNIEEKDSGVKLYFLMMSGLLKVDSREIESASIYLATFPARSLNNLTLLMLDLTDPDYQFLIC
jgi:hypothetical protein